MSAKNRWHETGGRAMAAAKAMNNLQQIPVQQRGGASVTEDQFNRAKGTFIGLFILLVTVWSTFLISAIFALRVNLDSCENCPEECACRSASPAWG